MRIVHKLSLSFALVLVLLGLSTSALFWNALHDILVRDLELKGRDLAVNLAELSKEMIQTGNLYALNELIFLTKNNNQEVRYVLLMDSSATVMIHTFAGGGIPTHLLTANVASEQASEKTQVTVFQSNEGKIHDILYPIEQGELGYLRIGLHEQEVQKNLFANLSKMMSIFVFIGALTLGIIIWLTAHFTRPLLDLTRISEAISRGLRPAAEPRTSSDEIGKLGQAIHVMTQSLRQHEQEEHYLLQRLINAQEDERKRISRELHDEAGQALTALILSLRAMSNQTSDLENKQQLLALRDQSAQLLDQLRHLAVDLRPPLLDDLGLIATLQKYSADYQKRYAISVEFIPTRDEALTPAKAGRASAQNASIDVALYRIVQECLTNIIRHAQATAVAISFHEGTETRLIIKDNGIGLPENIRERLSHAGGLGLYGIRERIEMFHGQLSISSEPPMWPTVLKISFPRKKVNEHD